MKFLGSGPGWEEKGWLQVGCEVTGGLGRLQGNAAQLRGIMERSGWKMGAITYTPSPTPYPFPAHTVTSLAHLPSPFSSPDRVQPKIHRVICVRERGEARGTEMGEGGVP